ncbi:hypothetical protein VTL71DRAFT_14832 [Oculimacula yallundae]|uniref:Peptidase metallopeptidase domain-containing protein n=1 Tax=Oculimacula yallundae TaxID=86028 RepID=A0ABR4CEX1_9HELO
MFHLSSLQWLLNALTLLIAFPAGTSAGHSLWEFKPMEARNKTFHFEHKRAHWIRPSPSSLTWPDKTIKYCYENSAARTKYDSNVKAAFALWTAAGLPVEYKMSLSSTLVCKAGINRKNHLMIKDTGALSTTPGLQRDDTEGPVMHLADDTSIGSLDVVANIAHEIGHAWGLLHPHQISTYYTEPMGTNPFESLLQFNCHNLKDYDKFVEIGISAGDPSYINGVCTDYAKAMEAGFSAMEFTTMGGYGNHDQAVPDASLIDWDSIMWYPSGAGGKGSASPGNDQRLPVLQRLQNGVATNIPIRLVPSQGDVQAIKALYNQNEKKNTPTLYNDPKSSHFRKFLGLKSSCK